MSGSGKRILHQKVLGLDLRLLKEDCSSETVPDNFLKAYCNSLMVPDSCVKEHHSSSKEIDNFSMEHSAAHWMAVDIACSGEIAAADSNHHSNCGCSHYYRS
ncbi:MAG: hypothetical protein GC178_02720 [Flavobacteriales bacterium]|nr:hypothetical protein [Flavobacteriales bacterium]